MVPHENMPNISNIHLNPADLSDNNASEIESTSMRIGSVPQVVIRNLGRREGPLYNEKGFLQGLQQSLGASVFGSGYDGTPDSMLLLESNVFDMASSTLYLHELHHRQVSRIFFNHQS